MSKEVNSTLCLSCARCCVNSEVQVSELEVAIIEDKTDLSREGFTYLPYPADIRALAHTKDGYCFFLEQVDGGRHSCLIYDFRPEICRNFPSNDATKEWCGRLRPSNV